MKKILLLIITIICTSSFCIHSYAIDSSSCVTSVNNIDIVFDKNCSFTEDEKQIVLAHFLNDGEEATPYGLICNLFGHKNTTEYLTTITHCINSTAPRCLEEEWELIVCSRCENVESTRLGFSLIYCCPES